MYMYIYEKLTYTINNGVNKINLVKYIIYIFIFILYDYTMYSIHVCLLYIHKTRNNN